MQITGIICEYNPLHLGHQKQIRFLRSRGDAVVCLMSGNFVQRGHPAVIDKLTRAKAAVACGADLVLELPVQYALSSAEGFAAGGVSILSKLCDNLCFGAEDADLDGLVSIAKALLSDGFSVKLRQQLDRGLSFPAARAAAIASMGLDAKLLETPNNILAIEYCKAILAQHSGLAPLPIHRMGGYHDVMPDAENPSATAIRELMNNGHSWQSFVPHEAAELLENAPMHRLEHNEKAILYRLRTMTETEFEALPYGSEGLWRKLMHACREKNTLEEVIAATKSKRYTRTRIDRMILCAYLGLTAADLAAPAPYCRVLAFNDRGREILAGVRDSGFFVNTGTDTKHPCQLLEQRCTALYGLFGTKPEPPDAESKYRVFYQREQTK